AGPLPKLSGGLERVRGSESGDVASAASPVPPAVLLRGVRHRAARGAATVVALQAGPGRGAARLPRRVVAGRLASAAGAVRRSGPAVPVRSGGARAADAGPLG